MKTIRRAVIASILCLGSALAAPKVVFDASAEGPFRPEVSTAEKQALMKLYVSKNMKTCPQGFDVLARFNGRFTQNTVQTAYLVSNCYDDVSSNLYRERWAGDLFILNGQKLVYFEPNFADDLRLLPPLGDSPLNTLLAQYWLGPKQGYFWGMSTVMAYWKGEMRGVLQLGMTYLDEGDGKNPLSRRRVLWVDPAKPNWLRLVEYTSPTCQDCQKDPYQSDLAKKTLDIVIDWRNPPRDAKWQEGL